MTEKKVIFINDFLDNIITIYFDTFFIFYFFKIANYEVLPLAKYYLSLYLFTGIGFILIRRSMKKGIKVPYFHIGIAMQALYIALIMLLKENIINHIYLVGIIKGIAEGFYYFPKNILDSEKISNLERQKFSGTLNIVNKISAIIVPIILGILLTYYSYTTIGKIFFFLFIIMFILSFKLHDYIYHLDQKFELTKFLKIIKSHKYVKCALLITFLSGLTYSSGVMGTIINLMKINTFHNNLNLGYVDSICAFIYLLVSLIFTIKIKKEKFSITSLISGILSFMVLFIIGINGSLTSLIIYLIVSNSLMALVQFISDNTVINLSNSDIIKNDFKAEFYLVRDIIFSISRCLGYIILLMVCLIFGMNYINYILIICGIAILLEVLVAYKMNK